MKTIAITGVMGSGKSTVSKMLSEFYPVYNTDLINLQLQAKDHSGYQKIIQEFGRDILNDNQEIDRQKLAAIVFTDVTAKEKLEQIMHPLIKDELDKLIKNTDSEFCFVEVPLLFEKDWDKFFDYSLNVSGNMTTIIERTAKNRNLTTQQVQERLNQQLSQAEKENKSNFIINNDKSLEDLQEKVVQLINTLNQLEEE